MAARTFIGDETSLKEQLATFVNTVKPDEIIVSGNIYDFEAKLQSYTLAAGILHNL
jgi:hypothetical protein